MSENTTEPQDDIIEGTATPLVDALIAGARDRSQDAREASVEPDRLSADAVAIKRNAGMFTAGPNGSAAAAVARRIELYRRHAVEGAVEGAAAGSDRTISGPMEAWRGIVSRQAEAAMMLDDHGRPNTLAASFVGKAIGAFDKVPQEREQGRAPQMLVLVSDAAAAHVLGLLRARDENK